MDFLMPFAAAIFNMATTTKIMAYPASESSTASWRTQTPSPVQPAATAPPKATAEEEKLTCGMTNRATVSIAFSAYLLANLIWCFTEIHTGAKAGGDADSWAWVFHGVFLVLILMPALVFFWRRQPHPRCGKSRPLRRSADWYRAYGVWRHPRCGIRRRRVFVFWHLGRGALAREGVLGADGYLAWGFGRWFAEVALGPRAHVYCEEES